MSQRIALNQSIFVVMKRSSERAIACSAAAKGENPIMLERTFRGRGGDWSVNDPRGAALQGYARLDAGGGRRPVAYDAAALLQNIRIPNESKAAVQ